MTQPEFDAPSRIGSSVAGALALGVDVTDLYQVAVAFGLNADVVDIAAQRGPAQSQPAQIGPSGGDRTALGAWYTPPSLASGIVDLALDLFGAEPESLLDPTCGSGVFLLSAASALVARGANPDDAVGRLSGFDLDPVALFCAAVEVANWCATSGGRWTQPSLRMGDVVHSGMLDEVRAADLVVGNPPFLSQLRRRTARNATQRAGVGRIGYADASAIVLKRSVDLLADGGVAALVMPRSFLSARDAAPVRQHLETAGRLAAAWFDDRPMFDAAVRVWAPFVVREPGHAGDVVLARGDGVEVSQRVTFDGWSQLGADAMEVPRLPAGRKTSGVLGDLAVVSADFRDWFYELARAVREAQGQHLDPDEVGVLTSGAIDPARILWGHKPVKLAGTSFDRPVVDRGWLEARSDAAVRLSPKLIVANQTSVIEVVVDTEGRWVGSTPTIHVLPRAHEDLWRLAAVLASPHATVEAMRRSSGNALSPTAMRLSARLVADLALPADLDAWDEAAQAMCDGEPLTVVAEAMCDAYGIDSSDPIVGWWMGRAGKRLA
ncbi:MAG: N-6 DNA methylase [Acidimicrobiales bacterium]